MDLLYAWITLSGGIPKNRPAKKTNPNNQSKHNAHTNIQPTIGTKRFKIVYVSHFILFLVAIAPLSNYPIFGKQKRGPVISCRGEGGRGVQGDDDDDEEEEERDGGDGNEDN